MGCSSTKENKTTQVKVTPPSTPLSTLSVNNVIAPSLSPTHGKAFNYKEEKSIHKYIKERKDLSTLDNLLQGLIVPCIVKELKDKDIVLDIALTSYQITTLRSTDYIFLKVERRLDKPLNNITEGYAHFLSDNMVNVYETYPKANSSIKE